MPESSSSPGNIVVGITGAEGLIGWHLRAFLKGREGTTVKAANRSTFADGPDALDDFVDSCDVVVHLAGMNRGDGVELETVNIRLADDLVESLERLESRAHIIFSSSTHIYKEGAYGRSKRICAERFRQWAKKSGGEFSNMILPHVFGESGRPFYNSVVSTFCHQLAQGEAPKIIEDSALELIHAQRVADIIYEAILTKNTGDVAVGGAPMMVSELLEKLRSMAASYGAHIVPDLRDPLDLALFNTYRSYLFPQAYPRNLQLHEDDRGHLFEAVKNFNGGQSFVSTTKPGITRGNHYHLSKLERFLVVRGQAEICLRRMFNDEIVKFEVNGERPQYIDIPTLHTHTIANVGDTELLTLFWAHEIYDPNAADTIFEPVILAESVSSGS